MKKLIILALFILLTSIAFAQNDSLFIGKFVNEEYRIFLKINLIEKNVKVPGQDVLGEVDGYIGSADCNHIWAIVSSEIKGQTVCFSVINNYGSEDFEAIITINKDGSIVFQHKGGSPLKFPVKGKWHKIPTKIIFIKEPIEYKTT